MLLNFINSNSRKPCWSSKLLQDSYGLLSSICIYSLIYIRISSSKHLMIYEIRLWLIKIEIIQNYGIVYYAYLNDWPLTRILSNRISDILHKIRPLLKGADIFPSNNGGIGSYLQVNGNKFRGIPNKGFPLLWETFTNGGHWNGIRESDDRIHLFYRVWYAIWTVLV